MHGQDGRKWITGGVLMLIGTLIATPAVAANFEICVASDAALATALDTARSVPVTAKIVQHALTAQNQPYDLKNTLWNTTYVGVQPGSELLGGYTAGCASRNIEVGNTRVVNTGGAQRATVSPRGNLTIEGLTFQAVGGLGILLGSDLPNGLKVAPGSTILFRRDAFLGATNNELYFDWQQAADSDSTIRVVDSLFANNADTVVFSCSLYVEVLSGGPEIDITNNTVADNADTVGGGCFLDDGGATGKFYLYNNIFYGNTGTGVFDLVTNTDQVLLFNNVFGARSGPEPILKGGNLTSDPKLTASYRLTEIPQSPAINAGENAVPNGGLPASDLDGGARVVGSIVDIGAYESSIDPKPVQTVTKTSDDGSAGTLRAAINSVNSNGGGTIKFAFASGSCPHVITINNAAGELDPLIVDATINGYSDTDALVNSLDPGDNAVICVILEAGGASPPARGLIVGSGAPDGVSVTIKGIGFSNFSTAGVDLQGGSAHSVAGNHFGGNIGGHAMQPNGYDVRLGANTHDDTVGGYDVADRNIIGDAVNSGIVIVDGSKSHQIVGNYIGVGWSTGGSTYTNRSNGARGIYVAGDHNTISGNLIGFNTQAGIVLDSLGAHDNLISLNFIGADIAGNNLGNSGPGIHLVGDSGGTDDAPNDNTIRSNTIADNGTQGVLVDVGQGNRVRKNSIYGNANLGIDLLPVGANFPQSDDGGLHVADEANRSQNFPVLTTAKGGNDNGTVAGALTTTPGDHTIDFYDSPGCDGSGYGEGKSWLGGVSVTVPVPVVGFQGTYSFTALPISAPLFVALANGSKVTATATDSNGNTSEFSACVSYLNDTVFTDGFEGPPPTF